MTAPTAPGADGRMLVDETSAAMAQVIRELEHRQAGGSPRMVAFSTAELAALTAERASADKAERERDEVRRHVGVLTRAIDAVAFWEWTGTAADEPRAAFEAMCKVARCYERDDELVTYEEEAECKDAALSAANAEIARLREENEQIIEKIGALKRGLPV